MTIPYPETAGASSSQIPDFQSDFAGVASNPQIPGLQSDFGTVSGAGTQGLQASFGGANISMDEETSRNLFATLFSKDNLEKIVKYAVPIAVAAIIAKMFKDYWNRPPDDPAPDRNNPIVAGNIVRGKRNVHSRNNRITVISNAGAGAAAAEYIGPGGEVTGTSEDNEIQVVNLGPENDREQERGPSRGYCSLV